MVDTIRTAFVMNRSDAGWIGGANYLSNLLHAIAGLTDRRITTVLIAPPGFDEALLDRFPVDELIVTPLVAARDPRRLLGRLTERVFGRDLTLAWLVRRHRIQVVSHMQPGRSRSPVPIVSWIPDFQEKHLPAFFDAPELQRRAAGQAAIGRHARRIIVSSDHARDDLRRYLPQAIDRARVLQFVAGFGASPVLEPLAELRKRYDLQGPFFYLPNQFWIHKNHRIVVRALAILKARGLAATVVASGHTVDYRHPSYFAELQSEAKDLGVEDMFRIVGMIPYPDVAALMRYCVAVINPSLFEGWSTTVEEAKSQGKAILLSDIPVHREQAPERGAFFSIDDAETLADLMTRTVKDYDAAAEDRFAVAAAAALPDRVDAFARRYQSIVEEAAQ